MKQTLFDEDGQALWDQLTARVDAAGKYWAEKPWADDELDLKHGTKCYRLTLSDGSVEYRYGWPTNILYRLGELKRQGITATVEIVSQQEWEAANG